MPVAEPARLVGALLVRPNHVLLGLRAPQKRSCPDTWDLFGGHVEAGESFAEALARELDEELGVAPVRPREIANHLLNDGTEYRIFQIDCLSGGEPGLRGDEHTDLRWFTADEIRILQPLASEAYRDLLLALLEGD
jgi:8-oxo-dGTP diphosphatase